MLGFMQGSVYQKTNAMSEIRKTNKDNFWAQAEVGTRFHIFSLLTRATSVQEPIDNMSMDSSNCNISNMF